MWFWNYHFKCCFKEFCEGCPHVSLVSPPQRSLFTQLIRAEIHTWARCRRWQLRSTCGSHDEEQGNKEMCDPTCMLIIVGSWFGNVLCSESVLLPPVPFFETHTLMYLYSFCIVHTLCMHGFINRGGSVGLFLVHLSCIMCTNRGQSRIINLIGLDRRAMLPH